MAEDFRISLSADDEITKRSEEAIESLNRLERKSKVTQERIRAINNERAKLARDQRAAAFEELGTHEKLTRLRERQLRVEQMLTRTITDPSRLAALKLSQARIASNIASLQGTGIPPVLGGVGAARGGGGLASAFGKFLPGGEKGAALAGALPGAGAVGGIAGIAAFGVAQGIRSLITEAMALDTQAEKTAESIAKVTRFSDPAVETLAEVGNAFKMFVGLIRKFVAEDLARQIELLKGIVGTSVTILGQMLSFLPGSAGKLGGRLVDFGSDLSGTAMARRLMGGTGEQDVGRAEQRLKEAQERRDAKEGRMRDREDAKGGTRRPFVPDRPQGYTPGVDDLARVGIFRGGNPNQLVDLQRQANAKLDSIVRGIGNLPEGIASNL